MAILFSDNFGSEEEGTSPPINWTPDALPLDVNEVDDAQYNTAPHSMWLKSKAGVLGWIHHDEPGGFTDKKFSVMIYFPVTNKQLILTFQSVTGNQDATKQMPFIGFDATADIKYYDGEWQDTGYNFTTGWHKVEITLDVDNDQFDMWYDDVKIVAGGGFRTSQSIAKSVHFRVTDFSASIWVDDVQIGEPDGWTGIINGIENPAKVNGIDVANITKINGV